MNIKIIRLITFILLIFMLSSCTIEHRSDIKNVCDIFYDNPSWYKAAVKTQEKWGTPVYVLMAIMYHESRFDATARPYKDHHLASSAYGYSQALTGTWKGYKKETHHPDSKRFEFSAAADFIGWYTHKVNKDLHIPLTDAYRLYLVYYAGEGGYVHHTYLKKHWLVRVAHGVGHRAVLYKKQLKKCKDKLRK